MKRQSFNAPQRNASQRTAPCVNECCKPTYGIVVIEHVE